jgi:hypothetical protein
MARRYKAFPGDFTTQSTALTGSEYLLVDESRITVSTLADYISPGGGLELVSWNGTDVTQFTTSNDIGTPVTPTIAFVSQPTQSNDAIRLTLGTGTAAGDGRIYWFAAPVEFQSMRIRMSVAFDSDNPIQPGDDAAVGLIFAASTGTGNGLSMSIASDSSGAGHVVGGASSSYSVLDGLWLGPSAVPGGYAWNIDFTFNGRLTDTSTYTPNGAPTMGGDLAVSSILGTPGFREYVYIQSTTWDPSVGARDTNRVGIAMTCAGGSLTATTGLLITSLTIETAA